MLLLEIFDQDTSRVTPAAKKAALAGDFKTYDSIMHPILNSKGSVHVLYFKVREEAGINDTKIAPSKHKTA